MIVFGEKSSIVSLKTVTVRFIDSLNFGTCLLYTSDAADEL